MSDTTIRSLVTRAYENAKAKGFRDQPVPIARSLALIRTELAEAIEADRDPGKVDVSLSLDAFGRLLGHLRDGDDPADEGWADILRQLARPRDVGEELADALIRVFDLAGAEGIDLERRLDQRFPCACQLATLRMRQKSADIYVPVYQMAQWSQWGMAGWLEHIQCDLSEAFEFRDAPLHQRMSHRLCGVVMQILAAAQWLGIDMEAAVLAKMERNEARPRLHGKAY